MPHNANAAGAAAVPSPSRDATRAPIQWASLNLARLQLSFSHREHALAAIQEAVRSAQQHEDNVCLAYALLWMFEAQAGAGAGALGSLLDDLAEGDQAAGKATEKPSEQHPNLAPPPPGAAGMPQQPWPAAPPLSSAASAQKQQALLQRCLARAHELGLPELAALASQVHPCPSFTLAFQCPPFSHAITVPTCPAVTLPSSAPQPPSQPSHMIARSHLPHDCIAVARLARYRRGRPDDGQRAARARNHLRDARAHHVRRPRPLPAAGAALAAGRSPDDGGRAAAAAARVGSPPLRRRGLRRRRAARASVRVGALWRQPVRKPPSGGRLGGGAQLRPTDGRCAWTAAGCWSRLLLAAGRTRHCCHFCHPPPPPRDTSRRLASLAASLQLKFHRPAALGSPAASAAPPPPPPPPGGGAEGGAGTGQRPLSMGTDHSRPTQTDRVLAACKLALLAFPQQGEAAALQTLLQLRPKCVAPPLRSLWLQHTIEVLVRGAVLRGEQRRATELLEQQRSVRPLLHPLSTADDDPMASDESPSGSVRTARHRATAERSPGSLSPLLHSRARPPQPSPPCTGSLRPLLAPPKTALSTSLHTAPSAQVLAATQGPSDVVWPHELELLLQKGEHMEALLRAAECDRTSPSGKGAGLASPRAMLLLAKAKAHALGGSPLNALPHALSALALAEQVWARPRAGALSPSRSLGPTASTDCLLWIG